MPGAGAALDRSFATQLLLRGDQSPQATAVLLPQGASILTKTWRQVADDVLRMIAMLDGWGVRANDRVVLWSDNRYEWIIVDLAIQALGAVHIPLHGSLTADGAVEQITHAEPRLAFVATVAMRDALARSLTAGTRPERIETLDATASEPSLLQRLEREADDRGQRLAREQAEQFDPHAMVTILYSSGTSGEPKAVALTHANLLTNAEAVIAAFGEQPSDRRLNFLPFSHIYARTCDLYTWVSRGSELALARSRDTIPDDCRATQPSIVNGVPYFYERIAHKIAESERTATPRTIQMALGTNIRACFCGGAALPVGTFDFFQERGVPLLPGYGLTESSPVIALSTLTDFRRGTVGKPIPGVEVRIAEDGELLTRGPHVMREYWKNAELTRETIREGWLHTGDLGSIDADGFVTITGRKKEMIALSTGKKAFPTHIEGLLCREPMILQALVVGDDQKYLSALIVPDPDLLRSWIKAHRLWVFSKRGAVRHPCVTKLYQDRIRGQLGLLPSCERVKRFFLLDRGFTIEAGLLTPKLSLRRDALHRTFHKEIKAMYAGGGVAVDYDDHSD